MEVNTAIRCVALIGLIALTLLHGNVADAQARPSPQSDSHVDSTVEADAWLRRLVGNFDLDGAFVVGDCSGSPPSCTGIKGSMDCIAVGNGPGVQCIINATWTLLFADYFPPMDLSSFLDPAMSLFGLDPDRKAINLMLVNDRGLPTSGFGTVKGDFVAFRTRCPRADEEGCQVGIRIEAKPDSDLNHMWIGNNLVISMRRVAPGKTESLIDRLGEVTSKESEEDVARANEDAREERELLALEPRAGDPVPEGPGIPMLEAEELDEVVAEGRPERRRQAQVPRLIADPDVVTVTRNSTKAGEPLIRMRIQPYTPQREIRLRAYDARNLAEGANSHLRLQRDRLGTDNGSLIRSATLEFTAGAEDADGLPALVPINATTSLFNFDYVRLEGSSQPLMVKLRNVMDPETRRCVSEFGLGTGTESFQNRFVLLGNRFGDCNRTVNSREGDLVFADMVPDALRQELRDLYEPVYNQFAWNLGSEPGMVFVIWRPASPRSDFRLVRSLNRTSLLVFNGPAWERGFTVQQRNALWDDIAAEQIERRMRGGNAMTETASDYLEGLARAERRHTTGRWLAAELPEWIAACGRALSLRPRTTAPRGDISHDCGLVVQFVYDAVARANSGGEDNLMRTWRALLADAYRRRQDGVTPSAFLDSSAEARRIVHGLLNGVADWTAFAADLGTIGVQLRATPGQLTPVQVQSLDHFRD